MSDLASRLVVLFQPRLMESRLRPDRSYQAKRRRISASGLSSIVGRENIHYMVKGAILQSRDLQFTADANVTSSASPFLPISLPDPNSLQPVVTIKVKEQVAQSFKSSIRHKIECKFRVQISALNNTLSQVMLHASRRQEG